MKRTSKLAEAFGKSGETAKGFFLPGQAAPAEPLANAVPKIKDAGIRKLKILVTVVDRSKANFYLDMLEAYEVNFQTAIYGSGTADNTMRGLLGISESDKAVLLSVIREDMVAPALAMLEEKFARVKHGKGIAFTIPFSSVMGVHAYCFLSNSTEKK